MIAGSLYSNLLVAIFLGVLSRANAPSLVAAVRTQQLMPAYIVRRPLISCSSLGHGQTPEAKSHALL